MWVAAEQAYAFVSSRQLMACVASDMEASRQKYPADQFRAAVGPHVNKYCCLLDVCVHGIVEHWQ